MDRISTPWQRWLAAGLWAGMPLLGLACSTTRPMAEYPELPPVRSTPLKYTTTPAPAAESPLKPVAHVQPAPAVPAPVLSQPGPAPVKPDQLTPVPITLDTVFRIAETRNPRIALAREKLNESMTTEVNSLASWLPNTYAGIAYYRHEGGNQGPDGRFIHASFGSLFPGIQIQSELDLRERTFQQIELQRQRWQSRAELSQVNNEILVETATTYVDLLTARRGEQLAALIEEYEQKLLNRAEQLAKTDQSANVLLKGMQATLANRRQMMTKLRQQGNAAGFKLVYLLGLPPGTCLNPMDAVLAPIELVDVTPPACEMVEQSLRTGPGIRELQGILATVQDALEKSYGIHNLLPIVQAHAYEGLYGAGIGSGLTFDNRLDVGLTLRWNLTQLGRSDLERLKARIKQNQAVLSYEDLRNKLAAGVQEAREGILFGREQTGLAAGQIRDASENYRLAERRMEEGLKDSSPADVLLGIRALEQAHFNYLAAISAHNKAQIRLMMLLGPAEKAHGPPPPAPAVLPGEMGKKVETLPEPRKVPGMEGR